MPDNIDDLVKRITQKHLRDQPPESSGPQRKRAAWLHNIGAAIGIFLAEHKRALLLAVFVLVAVFVGMFILIEDYLTKRQNYPERNVLFRSTNVVYLAGGSEEKGANEADRVSEAHFYEGGVESKIGTYSFMTTREVRDDIEYYNMDNSQKIRIVSAAKKPEIVQAGLRIRGSLDFREQFAQLIVGSGAPRTPQSYRVYKFAPERSLTETEVTVVEQADGSTRLDNRMIELRAWLFGWLWGKEFRAGTLLDEYLDTPANAPRIKAFYAQIKALDSQTSVAPAEREKMITAALALSHEIETVPIYRSYEDGIIDLLPQDSTIYLASDPGWPARVADTLWGKSAQIRWRVDNFWNLLPGWYPLIRQIHFGKGENTIYPFDKYNNGGYVIRDKYGELAKIEIEDFFLRYGQDVLYHYYLDLNGDGQLDPAQELLGTVLCRTTHDERLNLEKLIGFGRPKADVTFTIHYSFMAPDNDVKKGLAYFNLCAYIESMLPDQINRGFGKHSYLGYINDQRSDIMLFKELTIENMSRALTQESTLVAKDDLVKALIAAKRPYAEQVATAYGNAAQFAGQFQPSVQLAERRDWTWLGGLPLTLLFLGGAIFWLKRQRKQNVQHERDEH